MSTTKKTAKSKTRKARTITKAKAAATQPVVGPSNPTSNGRAMKAAAVAAPAEVGPKDPTTNGN
jgi:hypothetical protein